MENPIEILQKQIEEKASKLKQMKEETKQIKKDIKKKKLLLKEITKVMKRGELNVQEHSIPNN